MGCRPDATHVECGDNDVAKRCDPTGNVFKGDLELVPLVDAHVGICAPEEHAIDGAVPCREVVEEEVDGPLCRIGVVQKAIVDVALRRNEQPLSPKEFSVVNALLMFERVFVCG